jgi:6-phosphogluconolactonase
VHADAGTADADAGTADAGAATTWVLVSGRGPVRAYALDLATGALLPRGTADAGPNPSFLAVDPAVRHVYAVNEGGASSTVTAMAFDAATGALRPLNSAVVGSGPAHLAVDPSGAWVLVANYNGGSVVVLPIRPDGTVGPVKTTVQPGAQPHQVVLDAAGRSAFVPCKGDDVVAQYRFGPDAGTLEPRSPPSVATASGAGPRHLALHPNGRWAYLVNELDSTITALTVSGGRLASLGTLSTLPVAGFSGENTGAEVLVHPSGRWVYASNRGHDSIAQFEVNDGTGALSLLGHTSTLGETPRSFAIDPTGRMLLVANQGSGTVKSFSLDAGAPVFTGHELAVDSPAYVGAVSAGR